MSATPIFTGGNLRVRWHEWAGLRDWMDCEAVAIVGDFVVVETTNSIIAIPGMRIDGQLEVQPRPAPTPAGETP